MGKSVKYHELLLKKIRKIIPSQLSSDSSSLWIFFGQHSSDLKQDYLEVNGEPSPAFF